MCRLCVIAGSEGKSGQVDYVCSQCGHGILDIENVVFVPTRQASSTHNVSVPGIERPLILQHFVSLKAYWMVQLKENWLA